MEDPVLIDCPVCGDAEEHQVLKARKENLTVQCSECGDVRTFSPPQLRTVTLNVVISHEDQSWTDRIEVPTDESIRVGYEFEHAGHRMLVTAIESQQGRQEKALEARLVKTLSAIVFDTVRLKVSVNDKDVTRSHELVMDPDDQVYVGDVLEAGGELVTVKTLKSDQNRTLHKGFLLARNVRRAFCDPAPEGVTAGDRIRTRPRGAPAGKKPSGPTSRVRRPGGTGRRR